MQRVGAMFTLFFGIDRMASWDDAVKLDRERFNRFFHAAYDRGVLLAPSPFEALFLMEDHAGVLDEAIEILVEAVEVSA